MSIWIRTQDRETLTCCNYFTTYGELGKSIYAGTSPSDIDPIGAYATEERALEVLDEIQHFIRNIEIVKIGGGNCHEVPYVYEMPKEKRNNGI